MLAAYSQLSHLQVNDLSSAPNLWARCESAILIPLTCFFIEHENPINRKTKPIYHSRPARSLKQSFYNPSLSGIFKNNRKLLFGLASE